MKPHELKVGKIYKTLVKQPFVGIDLSPFLLLEIDFMNSGLTNLVKLKFLTKTKIEVFSVSIDRNFECLSI